MTDRALPRLSIGEILHPKSVAVFGASDNRDKFGGRIMYFLVKHRFGGRLVPINPRRSEVFGHKAYPTIGAARDKVDVAILAVPPRELVQSVADCAAAGLGCCVIMTTGFAEAGAEGAARQEEIAAIARRSGMRIVGPNCMGFINPAWNLTLTSSVVLEAERLLTGEIGFVSQSGALMVSVFDRAYGDGIGFSACVSLGNQSDLEICDFLEYLIDDPKTKVICVYVEGFVDPLRFVRAIARCHAKGKPLIVLKTGRTEAGVKAARSHTASLAGSYDVFRALCREHGVILVDDPTVMVRLADLLVRWPKLRSDGIAVISGSGGSTGILSDRLSEAGLRLASLSPATKAELGEILLPAQADNPADLGARKVPENVEIADTAMRALTSDPDVGLTIVALSSMPFFEQRSRLLAGEGLKSGKPVVCSVLPGPAAEKPRAALRELGCPSFEAPEDGMLRVLRHYVDYHRRPAPAPVPTRPAGIPTTAPNTNNLAALLRAYGIPVARESAARTVEDAIGAARKIGFPVALKGVAPGLVHKSDAGAVKLDIADADALRDAWREIATAVPNLTECLVQEMAHGRAELIVGIRRDPQFGPMVLVGSGGIFVELLRDLEMAPAPVSHERALQMLHGLRLAPVLHGIRGQPPLDVEAAANAIVGMSWLAADLGERLYDAEINPLVLRERGKGAVAVDVRAVIAGPP